MNDTFRSDVLRGRVALVTGGGSGICRGIARAYLLHGARVAILSRKLDKLESAANELASETGGECIPVAADVREPHAIETAIDAVLARFERLDIVVNGAAGNFLAPAASLSPRAFKTVLDIDTTGTFTVSRIAFDKRLRDHGGCIINISATLHYGATPMQVHASAAKAGVDAITRSLALEWAGLGVRVNGIAPGPIDETEGMARLAPGDVKARLERNIPIGRFGRIDEIANVALFLASDAASLVHGATLVVDGGASLGLSPRAWSAP